MKPLPPAVPDPTNDAMTVAYGPEKADGTIQAMWQQAVQATNVAFTIADPNHPDDPLIWVNPAFTAMTGYTLAEAVGHNCRFLQGPETDRSTVAALGKAIATERPMAVTLLNYRKDGTSFWNQLAVSPVFDEAGHLVSYVGVQTDVTDRVTAETQRECAYAAEGEARHEVDRAHQRAALLAEVTTRLTATLDVHEIVKRLIDLVVPGLADAVVIDLFDDHGEVERTVSQVRGGTTTSVSRNPGTVRSHRPRLSQEERLTESTTPILAGDAATYDWSQPATPARMAEMIDDFGATSVMVVPLIAQRNRCLASLSLFRRSDEPPYTPDDMAVALDVGRRAALTLDNARLYEHEHQVSVTLQRSLLPVLPSLPDVAIAARYLPGDVQADVGGDFYEVLSLPDGSIGVAVGDVLGHDLAAAAAMGHLRGLLRACAWNGAYGRQDPGEILGRVDQLVQGLDDIPLATVFYGCLERPTRSGGPWRLTYANAGHPPPMVREVDGTVRSLDEPPGVLLGVTTDTDRRVGVADLPSGSLLVAYTDGLVERRNEDLNAGFDRVRNVLQRLLGSPEAVADALMATAGDERDDDIAILVLQLLGTARLDHPFPD